MSEIVLGGVGAAIGSSMAGVGALAGFNIGVTLGSLLFPPGGPKLERGRIDEIRIQGAQQGSPIPIIYGRNRTAGTIIWTTGLTETVRSESSGKGGGGGSTTDYSYTCSLAVLVCEGTISKIRRIWANETVIYDWRTGGSPTVASFLDIANIRVYLGNQTSADTAIEADKGAGQVPAFKGMAYVVFERMPLAEVGNQIPNFTFEVESNFADLQDAMEDIAIRVGLESADYDFSDLSGYPTRGLVVGARTEASKVMDVFAKANLFEIVESGGQIRPIIRTGVSVLTIDPDDVGASESLDIDAVRYVQTVRKEETELPRELTVSYQSETLDFLQWTQTARRTTRTSENQDQVNYAIALEDEYARFLADAMLIERWVARAEHRFTLPYKYLALDPGDVVQIRDEGGDNRIVRIVEMSMGLIAQIEVSAVDDDPIIYEDPGLPASIPTGGGAGVDTTNDADLLVFDTTAPYDSWAEAPYLGLVAGRTSPGWLGGDANTDPLLEGYASGSRRTIASFSASSIFGYTTNDIDGILATSSSLSDATGLDETSTVKVELTSGTLSSCTYDEMVQEGRNLCVIGDEILQFQTATLVSGKTYTLSNFLRYRRGTDYLIGLLLFGDWAGHVQGEGFVLFDTLVKSYAYATSSIGVTQEFRLVEFGKDYSSGLPAYTEPLVLGGKTRKPYGPCDLRYTGDRSGGSADVTLSWTRRVRKNGYLVSYVDAPLDELVEGYLVEIYSFDLSLLLNTYEVTGSTSFTYSVAQQTTDGVEASSFQFVVKQRSLEPGIGEGFPFLQQARRAIGRNRLLK